MSIAPAILRQFYILVKSKFMIQRKIEAQTYDKEQIQVSIITVCALPRRFKMCSRQASRQTSAFSITYVSQGERKLPPFNNFVR
jgi:hypothetical protein